MPGAAFDGALGERLLRRVIVAASGCWEWQGCRPRGYGQIRLDGGMRLAHRAAWKAFRGPIPDGLCVLHRCDNPPCLNPEHLFIGTRADNNADKAAKGRARGAVMPGRSNPSAKLTEDEVRQIRASVGQTQRALAARFGVTQPQICAIRLRKSWK